MSSTSGRFATRGYERAATLIESAQLLAEEKGCESEALSEGMLSIYLPRTKAACSR